MTMDRVEKGLRNCALRAFAVVNFTFVAPKLLPVPRQAANMNTRILNLCTAIVVVSTAAAFGQSPVNDNFTNRTAISGSTITVAGTLAGATIESPEADGSFPGGPLSTGGSVWWTWTASESTTVLIAMLRD